MINTIKFLNYKDNRERKDVRLVRGISNHLHLMSAEKQKSEVTTSISVIFFLLENY